MAISIRELMDALPVVEQDESTVVEPSIRQAISAVSSRPIPTGSLRRLSLLGGLQAKIAVAYLFHWLRGWFQSANQQQKDLAETNLKAALKLLDSMGYMRGAVMKVGQLLANCQDIVPDGIVQTLEQLHFQAPPMHFSLLREAVINELGDEPESIFAEFDETAFAAASLGQVHRARLKSGELVAVKIQYPGIATTIRSDFRNLFPLLLPSRLTRDWENLKKQFDFVRRSIEQETDYVREAETQMEIRRMFYEEEGIVVPRVYADYSTDRILTMDFIEGDHLDQLLAKNPTQEARNEYSLKHMRASARILYQGRYNNVDVHPGNYLFLPDGRLGLIDFGCVVRYHNEADWSLLGRVNHAMLSGDEDSIRTVMKEWQRLTDAPRDAEALQLCCNFAKWCWKPYYDSGPFDFADSEYLQKGVDMVQALVKKRVTRSHPTQLMQFRWQVGAWMLQYRLGACIDPRPILQEEVRAADWDTA